MPKAKRERRARLHQSIQPYATPVPGHGRKRKKKRQRTLTDIPWAVIAHLRKL